MGVFDFIKDTGSKILHGGGSRRDKIDKVKEAATAAKSKTRSIETSTVAEKARTAADAAREATADARERAAEQAEEAKKKAAAAREAAAEKQASARAAFNERRAEARKADELEDYLEQLGLGNDIDVRFDDGVVYLSGEVEDQQTLERVVLAVGNVEGVEKVDEELEVAAPSDAARLYTVKSGDTLSGIAKDHYGDANRYMDIFEANRPMLSDPNMIYPGQTLRIP